MTDQIISRRRLLQLGLGAGAAALLPWGRLDRALASGLPTDSPGDAYQFLGGMMDLWASGSTLRLSQSYYPYPTTNRMTIAAFTYDNALMILSYLARGTADDLTRAGVLGDSLLNAQAQDSFKDGRLRNSYDPTAIGTMYPAGTASTTGNLAWAGIALSHLFDATHSRRYLNGAITLGTWIQKNTYDTRGTGGYTGGYQSDGTTHYTWKATEHNIDAYVLFSRLYNQTRTNTWRGAAAHALTFVTHMWDRTAKYFWTGTANDGRTLNKDFIPEDIQSWSYLALHGAAYAPSLDWAAKNLAATDGTYQGVSFGSLDTTGVWFEGTAHMAMALAARNRTGDSALASTYLNNVAAALTSVPQTATPSVPGRGVPAASHDGLQTDGAAEDVYYDSLHTGATAWYLLASQGRNPLSLK